MSWLCTVTERIPTDRCLEAHPACSDTAGCATDRLILLDVPLEGRQMAVANRHMFVASMGFDPLPSPSPGIVCSCRSGP